MNEIKTGYTPEFGLGAFFQGVNAANADAFNEEELLKQRLANQQSQVMNPLEARLKELSIAPAEYQEKFAQAQVTDPNYIKSVLQGTKDTNAKIGFEMQKARDTLTSDVGAINAKNRVAITNDNLFNSFREAQKSGDDVKAKSILNMLVQDPKFQQNLQEQAAKDAAAMSRQAAGDEAAMARLKEQERIRSAEEDRRLKEKLKAEPDSVEKAIVNEILTKYPPGEERNRQLALAAELIKKVDTSPKAGVIFDAEGKPSYGPKDREYWPGKPTATPITNFSKQDEQALAWANANPTDPRAIAIKKKLGAK